MYLFLRLSCCPAYWSEPPVLLSARTVSKFATPFVEFYPLALASFSLATGFMFPALLCFLQLFFSLLVHVAEAPGYFLPKMTTARESNEI